MMSPFLLRGTWGDRHDFLNCTARATAYRPSRAGWSSTVRQCVDTSREAWSRGTTVRVNRGYRNCVPLSLICASGWTRVRTGGAVDCGSAEGGGHGSGRVDREFAQTCRHRVRKFGCIAMGEKSGPLVACKWLVGLSIYPSPKCTLLALHPEMPQISTRRAPSSASRRSVVP